MTLHVGTVDISFTNKQAGSITMCLLTRRIIPTFIISDFLLQYIFKIFH